MDFLEAFKQDAGNTNILKSGVGLAKYIANQFAYRSIDKLAEEMSKGIKIQKEFVALTPFGVVSWNGHGEGKFQIMTRYTVKTGNFNNGKELTKIKECGPNQAVEWPKNSVATDKYGLTHAVQPEYAMHRGQQVVVNPKEVGIPQIGVVTIDFVSGADPDNYYLKSYDKRKNWFTFSQLQRLFGEDISIKDVEIKINSPDGEEPIKIWVPKLVVDKDGVTIAQSGENGKDVVELHLTDANGKQYNEMEVFYNIINFELSAATMSVYMQKVLDWFLVCPKVLADYQPIRAKKWGLMFAHPSWIVDKNQVKMIITSHDLEEKFFAKSGLKNLDLGKKNELLIRLGKDILSGLLTQWFSMNFLVYPKQHYLDAKNKKAPANDGNMYILPNEVLKLGHWGLMRGVGLWNTRRPFSKEETIHGWCYEPSMLKWCGLTEEQTLCGAKGRFICHPQMANARPHGTDNGAYVITLEFYMSRNECKDRSKEKYNQNHQFEIQADFDYDAFLQAYDKDGTLTSKSCRQFYEEPRDKAMEKTMSYINDINGDQDRRVLRAVEMLRSMDRSWSEDSGVVNNSMKIKALMGIMTNREIPKFEQSLFDKLKSWDTDNAIWVGIVFSDWWILQDDTRVELKENEVLVSRTTFERVQQLAKEHNLTVTDAFKLWLTLIGYPITTKHSFMTVKIVAVDDIVIGDFVCAHPLIGELMQRDGDDFVQACIGLVSKAEVSWDIEAAFDKTPTKMDTKLVTPMLAYYMGRWFQDHIGPIANMLYRVQGALRERFERNVMELQLRMHIAEVILAKNLHNFAQGAKKPILAGVTVEEIKSRLSARQIAILCVDGGTVEQIAFLSRSINGMRIIAERICKDGEHMFMYNSNTAKMICPTKKGETYVRIKHFRSAFLAKFAKLQNVKLPNELTKNLKVNPLANDKMDAEELMLINICSDLTYKYSGKMLHRMIVEEFNKYVVFKTTNKDLETNTECILEMATWVGVNDRIWAKAAPYIFRVARVYSYLASYWFDRSEENPAFELISEAINAAVVLLTAFVPAKIKSSDEMLADYDAVRSTRLLGSYNVAIENATRLLGEFNIEGEGA